MDEKNIITNSNQQNETVTDDIEMKTQKNYEISLYKVKYPNNNDKNTRWT